MTKLPQLSQNRNPLKRRKPLRRRSPWILLGLIVLWSLCVGVGLAQAFEPQSQPLQGISTKSIGTVDPIAEEYVIGQELYLENCATCHIGVPPAVLPSQIWEYLLNDTDHYGVALDLPPRFDTRLILDYLTTYSRAYYDTEVPTFTIARSRFFTALHPQVEFAVTPNLQTCVTCHPRVEDFNFRDLSEAWQ